MLINLDDVKMHLRVDDDTEDVYIGTLITGAVTFVENHIGKKFSTQPNDGLLVFDDNIRQAVLMIIGHWYAVRETVNVGNVVNDVPFATTAILDQYRVPTL
jgi:uncharacterized phage protein (possible DNA packaging)